MSLIRTVLQAPSFRKKVKKLHPVQKQDLDQAIRRLMQSPELGEQKKGDLRFLRVYKFKIAGQEALLGYAYQEEQLVLNLLALGVHENFYRDIKRGS